MNSLLVSKLASTCVKELCMKVGCLLGGRNRMRVLVVTNVGIVDVGGGVNKACAPS